jgi:GLPGLI family protein
MQNNLSWKALIGKGYGVIMPNCLLKEKRDMQQLLKRGRFLLFLLAMFYLVSDAQNQMGNLIFEEDFRVIDSVEYEILYEVNLVEDILKPGEKLIDRQVLQIGTNTSKYFSKVLFKNDSINTILTKKNTTYYHGIPKGAAVYEVIRNRKAKTMTVTHRSDDVVFRYTEAIPNLSWEIHKENKKILHYTCQRATAKFRGREYEAWFTPEIPLREGPYKFGGLPGLILEIADSQKHYVYSCIAIKKPKDIELIKIRNWPFTETTREKLQDFLARKHDNPAEYYRSRGVTLMIKKDGGFVEAPKDFSIAFNPIELE